MHYKPIKRNPVVHIGNQPWESALASAAFCFLGHVATARWRGMPRILFLFISLPLIGNVLIGRVRVETGVGVRAATICVSFVRFVHLAFYSCL